MLSSLILAVLIVIASHLAGSDLSALFPDDLTDEHRALVKSAVPEPDPPAGTFDGVGDFTSDSFVLAPGRYTARSTWLDAEHTEFLDLCSMQVLDRSASKWVEDHSKYGTSIVAIRDTSVGWNKERGHWEAVQVVTFTARLTARIELLVLCDGAWHVEIAPSDAP